MVNLKILTSNPKPGETFSVKALDGVGTPQFYITLNGNAFNVIQQETEIKVTIPENENGELIIKVRDDEQNMDMIVMNI